MEDLAIPGNHDYWAGYDFPLGHPASNLANYFHAMPSIRTFPLSSGKTISFIRLDSDSDVHPLSLERFLGIGSFESQIRTLSQRMRPDPGDEIRVLIMHHSPRHKPAPLRGRPYGMLEIHPNSRAALDQFLVGYRISIALTGHLHEAKVDYYPNSSAPWPVLEARSGSTTQIDSHPASTRHYNVTRPLAPNTLIVHRVLLDGTDHIWRASIHQRSRLGFSLGPIVEVESKV